MCVRALTPLGHSMETASDAEQAITCFEKRAFDLLIADYRMPGKWDGLALGQEIKRRFPQTQLILMTGFPTLENAIAALRVGASDYLVKPFDREELISSVNGRHMTLGEIARSPGPESPGATAPFSSPSGRLRAKILLVDDSRTIRMIFQSLFEKSGYDVLTAADGEDALRTALEQKPDLVILDGSMPRLDGFEVCRRLRLDAGMKSTKILMLTGGAESEESRRAQQAGADRFISKTVRPQEILDIARLLLA